MLKEKEQQEAIHQEMQRKLNVSSTMWKQCMLRKKMKGCKQSLMKHSIEK